jgi:hypothetical protein
MPEVDLVFLPEGQASGATAVTVVEDEDSFEVQVIVRVDLDLLLFQRMVNTYRDGLADGRTAERPAEHLELCNGARN